MLVLFALIIVYLMNNSTTSENFRDTPWEAPPYVERKVMPSTQILIPKNKVSKVDILKSSLKDKVGENRLLDYNQILLEDNQDLTYYENDVLNQSKINENAYDIINQIDLVDYGKVTTGMDKCNSFFPDKRDLYLLTMLLINSSTALSIFSPFATVWFINSVFTFGLSVLVSLIRKYTVG